MLRNMSATNLRGRGREEMDNGKRERINFEQRRSNYGMNHILFFLFHLHNMRVYFRE